MQAGTHDALWRAERKMYAIADIRFPRPVRLTQAVIGAAVLFVWWIVVYATGLNRVAVIFGEWAPGATLTLVLIPPVVVAYVAGQQVLEGRTAFEWAASAIRWVFLPRELYRMGPVPDHVDELDVSAAVWRPKDGS